MQKIKNILFVLTCLLASNVCKAQFTSGSGTAADPWIITTAQQLDNLRNYLGEDHRDKHFKLGNDIDLSAYIAQTYSAEGWLPIGQSGSSFCCQIDGDNHSVTGLWINRSNMKQVGLFGYAEKLENISVATDDAKGGITTGISAQAGALASFCRTILNCHASGVVTAPTSLYDSTLGGLVGKCSLIKNSSSSCNVSNNTHGNTGGIAGNLDVATDCYATGTVTGDGFCGGLAGVGYEIVNCYATGAVTVRLNKMTGGWAGGLVARCNTIKQSYATGSVTGRETAGGLADAAVNVFNCYATGNVEAAASYNECAGGLVRELTTLVRHSYATGSVKGKIVGGLVGTAGSAASVEKSYFLQRSGLTGIGVNKNQRDPDIKALADIVHAASFDGFDFDNVWAIDEGCTSPYLRNMGDYRPVNNEPVESISDGSIRATSGNLHIRASQPATLSVYSIVGVQLYRQSISAGETSIALPQGIYIAKLGNQTQKVVVR